MKTMTCRWRLARLPPDLCTGSATAEFAIVLPSVIAIACSVRDEDVLVTIKVETMVLVASSVERMARAGPVSCTEGDNYHNNGP